MEIFQTPPFSFIPLIHQHQGKVFLVGGVVRDFLLKKKIKDYDFVITGINFDELIKILETIGYTNQVGKSFGVIKFKPKNDPQYEFDLSLPRLEKSTGPKHTDFKVDYDPHLPIEKDLARRDFTINAMAYDIKEDRFIDPFDGKTDLKNGVLKQVFENTFIEDPLRLLRAIQFSARFNLTIEEKTATAIKENAQLIHLVSKERIIIEIGKLFLASQPSKGIDLMKELNLLGQIFPFLEDCIGVTQPNKENEDVYTHTMKVLDAAKSASELDHPGDLDIMFSALLHDIGKPQTKAFDAEKNQVTFYGHQNVSKKIAKEWLNEYRASHIGVDIPKVLNLIKNHMFETKSFYSDKAIRRFINKVGKKHMPALLDLRVADKKGGRFPDALKGIMKLKERITEELNKETPFSVKDLAISGHDLIELGLNPSPQFKEVQLDLLNQVLDDPSLNDKNTLIKIVKEKYLNHD